MTDQGDADDGASGNDSIAETARTDPTTERTGASGGEPGSLAGPRPEERPHPDTRRNGEGVRIAPDATDDDGRRRAVFSVLVDHEPGVLSEVSALFSRRRFNIESLTVGPTADPERARITVVCEEGDAGVEQVRKQLQKLLPVIAVRELPGDAVRRELAMVKVDCADPAAVRSAAAMYDGDVVDACPETATVEITGSRQKIEAAVETLSQFGVREVVRTGPTALARSTTATTAADGPSRGSTATETPSTATDEPADEPTPGRSGESTRTETDT